MASYRDNADFLAFVVSSDLLDEAVDWIASRMRPDEVFDQDVLFDWCRENAMEAHEVCPDWALHEWAELAGYVPRSEVCP
jgi:hypothetical protein